MKTDEQRVLTRFYFGHHKCASQYIKGVMSQSARLMGWSVKVDGIPFVLPYGYHQREPFVTILTHKRQMLAEGKFDLICLENADNEAIGILEEKRNYRGFHIIRDPRDIVVSGYFSHHYSHPVSASESPWLYEYREYLNSLPTLEAGLLAEIEFCLPYFERLREWNYNNPRVLEVRYESLIAAPQATFQRIFDFLRVELLPFAPMTMASAGVGFALNRWLGRKQQPREALPVPLLSLVLWHNRFQRRSGGRQRGKEIQQHHYRKGVAGDWRTYFTPPIKDAFKARYPLLLPVLGYETDDNW